MTLLRKKNHYFKKEFLNKTIFFNSVHPFAHIRQHYFSKYWGVDQCMGRPPTSNFGGRSPQSPAPVSMTI